MSESKGREQPADESASKQPRLIRSRLRRLRRWVGSATGSTALISIAASLVGALVGGAATAITTQATIRAQSESVDTQLQAQREMQIVAERGRAYTEFLDQVFDLKQTISEYQACGNTKSYGSPPDVVSVHFDFPGFLVHELARCDAVIASYPRELVAVEKSYNSLYMWGSPTFIADARAVLSIFPEVQPCAFNTLADSAVRSCTFTYRHTPAMLHLWYAGDLFDEKPSVPAPAVEPPDDYDTARPAWDAFAAAYRGFDNAAFTSKLVDVGVARLRHDFCVEVTGTVASCA